MQVDANTYISAGAGYQMSSTTFDSKHFGNLVLRVRYKDLAVKDVPHLMAAGKAPIIAKDAKRNAKSP
jgi:hypothetical protein